MSTDDSIDYAPGIEAMVNTVGALSCMGGLSIILTLSLFPSMMYTEKNAAAGSNTDRMDEASSSTNTAVSTTRGELNIYSHMIFMLSLSEAIAAGAFAMGFPDSSTGCITQGFLLQFFQRAKWIWNTLIGVQLYKFMVHQTKGFKVWQMHCVCWSICLILELLPMMDEVEYGSDDQSRGHMVCYFKTKGHPTHMYRWFTAVYFIPLVICVLVMIYYSYQLWKRFRYFSGLAVQTEGTLQISRLVRTMILYPVAMLITTFPNMFMFLYSNLDPTYGSPKVEYLNGNICFAWSFSYGIWLCAIFFVNSQEAKRRWRAFLFNVPYVDIGNRLVRADGTWQQTTEEVNRIETGMDNALDSAAFSSGRSFGSRQGSSVNSSNGSAQKNENTGTGKGYRSGDALTVKVPDNRDEIPVPVKGVSGSLASVSSNGSPVYSSQSAHYGGIRRRNDDEDDDDEERKSPMHTAQDF